MVRARNVQAGDGHEAWSIADRPCGWSWLSLHIGPSSHEVCVGTQKQRREQAMGAMLRVFTKAFNQLIFCLKFFEERFELQPESRCGSRLSLQPGGTSPRVI